MKMVRKSLPVDIRKKREVIKKLAKEVFPDLDVEKEDRKASWNKISPENIKLIEEFYIRDDISRQAPGLRDVISIKSSGMKNHLQKRHLIFTIKEAFAIFKEENPAVQIKLTKFYELRPKHVLLTSETPHNVCVCKYHANFNYLTEAINKVIPVFPKDGKEILSTMCCDASAEKCMDGSCSQCETDIYYCLVPLKYNSNEITALKWKQWEDSNCRPHIVEVTACLSTALDKLQSLFKHFKLHCFVKREQHKTFENKKLGLHEHEALLQVDFAENYSAVSQDEIQSAHWSHQQITVFTAVAWLGQGKVHSFAIISDCLSHDKYCVWIFLKKIICYLKQSYGIEHVSVFSDGCAAQFKNKYTLSNLRYMKEDYGVTGEWHFFATSHGKGAVDGIGGLLKRIVWNGVKSRKTVIQTALDFYSYAKNKVNHVSLFYIPQADIIDCQPGLNQRWSNIRSIKGLQSNHFFKVEDKKLHLRRTSTSQSSSVFS